MIPVPQPVLEALAGSFGSTLANLDHFAGGREESDGVVYAYPHREARRLLKIMAIPVQEQRKGLFCLDERLRFMRYLGENDAPIAFPCPSPQGNLYETFAFESHLWVGYSMEIAPGKNVPAEAWNAAFFRQWGQTVGMLHRLARQYPSWRASVDPASGQEYLTWREEWDIFYHWCQDEDVKQKWVEMRGQLEALPITREVYGFIHNDPHVWNLLADGERITLLDFDVANHHWFVNDVAIACQSVLFTLSGGIDRPVYDREKLHEFLSLFMQGYTREHDLPSEWLERLDLFIAYRRILLFTVMNDWIRSKPEWHASWKEMILSTPEVVGTL
ncbi:MAG: phosphotransferase [Anaerolineae bacterium]|jgi:Ser/Thr protein kinase RdoA (MazF antagonist)